MKWLKKYLPAWERERYEARIKYLEQKNQELKLESEVNIAYTRGLQESLRAIKKITINNEVRP